jgi:hypothetical protein
VQHVVTAGAPAYRRLDPRDDKKANDVHCEASDVRASVPDEGVRMQGLVKLLGFTKLLTKVMVAVPHRSGMCPFEINSSSAAFLDWVFMMIKEHATCIFDARVLESLGRMKVRHPKRRGRRARARAADTARAMRSKGTKAGTSSPRSGCRRSWPLWPTRTTA